MTIWDKLTKEKKESFERHAMQAPTPDKALSHGVICLTGPKSWTATDVESGIQCQHIHPKTLSMPWICLACNRGSAKAEAIAAKHGKPAEVTVDSSEIKFKMKGHKPSKKLISLKKSA